MKANEVIIEQYHVALTREQLQLIAAALGELPYKVASPLLDELQRQVNEETSRQMAVEAVEREVGRAVAKLDTQTDEPPEGPGR